MGGERRPRVATGGIEAPDDQHDAGDAADDQGVEEGARHGDQRLPAGVIGLGRGSRNGCRTHAGLVGEDAARHTVANGGTDGAPHHGVQPEGRTADEFDSRNDPVVMEEDDGEPAQHVDDGHERHDERGGLGNALDAAQHHDGSQDGQRRAGDPGIDVEAGLDGLGHRVGLHRAADAEGGQHAKQGKQHRQPLDAQAALDVVHGAAAHLPLVVGDAVLDGQHGLAVLGGHAEEGGDPHPEDGARATGDDGRGHAGDVAGTDGGRERRHQRPEVADVALVVLLVVLGRREGLLQRHGQHVDLQEEQAKRQVDGGAAQQDEQGCPPDVAAQPFKEILQCLHGLRSCVMCSVRVPPALLGKRPALRNDANSHQGKSLDNFAGRLLQYGDCPDW